MSAAEPAADLVEWLLGCITEDEVAARACEHPDGPHTLTWSEVGPRRLTFDTRRGEDYLAVRAGDWDRILVARDGHLTQVAAHIARQDPARTLHECQVKRLVLAEHPIRHDLSDYERSYGGQPFGCSTCHDFDGITMGYGYCRTTLALAFAYSDRPGYQEEWRP